MGIVPVVQGLKTLAASCEPRGKCKCSKACRKKADNCADEEIFRSILEAGLTGVTIGLLREDGTTAYCNAGLSEKLGYTPEDLIDRPLLDFFWQTEVESAREQLASHLAGVSDLIQFESALRSRTGEKIEVLITGKRTLHEGRPASVGVIVDVTERYRIQRQLHASEEKFRQIVENAPDAILLYDGDRHCFIEANAAAEKLFGRPRGEIVGFSPQHFYSPGQPDGRPAGETVAEHDRRAQAGETLAFERRIRRPNGEDRICQVTMVRLPTEKGCLQRASLVDITESEQRRHALARTNRALRTLSRVNNAVVRAASKSELFEQVCLAIVETGGYRMAWVGEIQGSDAKAVRFVAYAGEGARAFAPRFAVSGEDVPIGRGVSGRAIRTGEPQVTQNLLDDPTMALWHALASEAGVSSALSMPLKDQHGVFGVLLIHASEPDAFDAEELKLLNELAGDLSFGVAALRNRAELVSFGKRLHAGFVTMIAAIARTIEARDAYTAGHQQRVAQLAVAIARKLALSDHEIEGIYLASVIHDIGKIRVPAEILSKPGRLSPIEFALIQEHAEAGYQILKDIDFPWPIGQIVRQHHERLDGSGYPRSLKGDDIVIQARILGVADTVDAMISHRPYRPGLGVDAALAEIVRNKQILYDPAVVDACVQLFRLEGFGFAQQDARGEFPAYRDETCAPV